MKHNPATKDRRLCALRAEMSSAGLDAVALVPGANFQYVTGGRFMAMERPTILIIPADGECRMVLPALEESSWMKLGVAARLHIWADRDGYDAAVAGAAAGLDIRRLGVEGQRMRVFEELALRRAIPEATVVDAHHAISSIRLRKEPDEIAALRRAIAVSETALAETLKAVHVGMTEREVESALLSQLYASGAAALAFPPIVVAGPQAADPHGHAGDYRIRSGDTLLFDFGAASGGYNADITRTVFVGEPSDDARAHYETVLAANRVGHATAKPGVTAAAVDDAVMRVLEDSPFVEGDLIKTGHGLGLDVHEAPQIMRGNETVLEPGMVFTIEPGLYLAGRRGVRIEDDVVVTETGIESLTSFPRELLVVG